MSEVREEIRSVVTDVLDKGGATWAACAEAGLLGLAAPEEHGGEGLGLGEVAVLLHEVGARALDLPVWETLACGLLTIASAGTPDQAASVIPRIVAGELLIAPALNEPGNPLPTAPGTTLRDGKVSGHKIDVSVLDGSTLLMVSTDGGVVLVDPEGPGVTATANYSSRSIPVGTVRGIQTGYLFDEAPAVEVLPEAAAKVLREHATAGLLLLGDGLVAGALALTAGYIKERVQFGRKLAEFQAVAVQIADVFVVARMASLAADAAAWRVAEGLPAAEDLAVGAAWFTDRVPTALQTCHHLHGGMGVDETYPLHFYFSRVKDIARHLGGKAATLAQVAIDDGEGKNLELTESQRAFKDEVRAYFSTLVSDEDKLEMMENRHGPAYHRNIKQMGSDGWMGVGWPTQYGGKGLGEVEQQIFANEASYGDIHLPSVTLQTVGPTLQAFGTEKQKDLFLNKILAGDVHFAIGYSEADAGTDLASLRCAAKKDPATGDWIVNGQKMWTTGGHAADYLWLAVRTDPDAPKHKGISVLIVDTKDPGYSWTPIITCDGSHHVNATYYNDVRVPADMLVGEENEGWRLITTQLNHERIMLGPAGRLEGLRDEVIAWAKDRKAPDGTPLLEVPAVRDTLARVTVSFRVNELLNWQVAGGGHADPKQAVADASSSKVFASDEVQVLGLALEEIVSAYGDPADPDTATLLHSLDATSKRNLVLTFGGGVNEVQRELIAMFGLGLPKVPR
ncbi:acyl-CoA dehydrogenase [Nocardioides marmoriginsengisoli]|uniref:Acyl-CoA dehydrogenase n=1 Tax=Nocardioides marmoriginsengisoli TaxID=661483 RepID=A0A3N0CMW5_9ACTN|nr:acyl-CoA dehydrogenase [Nocardioides marmoriginsengisoli]RNL64797.1 acyl-CoA dehydrogenase [Nocardioides marmoriginsengisoli]